MVAKRMVFTSLLSIAALYAGGCLTLLPWNKGKCVLEVDAAKVVNQAKRANLMGLNIATYHGEKKCAEAFRKYLDDIDIGLVRIPGGSLSDKFYWNGNGVLKADGTVDRSKFKPCGKQGYWKVDYAAYKPGFVVNNDDWSKVTPVVFGAKKMQDLIETHPVAKPLVTVNIGTGTPEMAAEWVRWANVKNHYDIKYWELGNELNGFWEAGHATADGTPMTGEIYAEKFAKFAKAMKAVDPTIKIGGPACDVNHHEDFFTPLFRDAGEHVDFLTFHFYSLRSSIAPEKELFDGLDALAPVIAKLDAIVKQYQPERLGQIEYSITEWNSKLPKDQDAYRLFNGLWFSAWVGEMIKAGVDSATVWDIFSGKDNGHGLLVDHDGEYVPTGRYWAFWLWSRYMEDALLESTLAGSENLHAYATKGDGKLSVMIMNESRDEAYDTAINLKGFDAAEKGLEVTFSSRQYFWNPYAFEAKPNSKPNVEEIKVSDGMTVHIPPYCVKVFQFEDKSPDLKLLLPKAEFCDMEVEGWIRAFQKDSEKPYAKDLGRVEFSVEGPAEIATPNVVLANSTVKFILKPIGKPGKVTVKAKCAGIETSRNIEFKPVEFEEFVAWTFENGKLNKKDVRVDDYGYTVDSPPGLPGKALRFDIPENAKDGHLVDIVQYPKDVPRKRIGGMVFDLILPDSLVIGEAEDGAKPQIQAVLQSTGAYWIPCGSIQLDKMKGKVRKIRFEVPDKKYLKVMDRAFSVVFTLTGAKNVRGPIYLDNVGFLLRPKKNKERDDKRGEALGGDGG